MDCSGTTPLSFTSCRRRKLLNSRRRYRPAYHEGKAGHVAAARVSDPRGLAERGYDGKPWTSVHGEGVFWSHVAERRLNPTVLFDRSAVAPRRRIVCLAVVRLHDAK